MIFLGLEGRCLPAQPCILSQRIPSREILQSLENPLGDRRLEDFRGVKSVAIAISDETRPIPYRLILPPLLERLDRMGIAPSSIRLLVASGLHPPMDQSRDLSNILPSEILKKIFLSLFTTPDRRILNSWEIPLGELRSF